MVQNHQSSERICRSVQTHRINTACQRCVPPTSRQTDSTIHAGQCHSRTSYTSLSRLCHSITSCMQAVCACMLQSFTAGVSLFTTDAVPCNMCCSTCSSFPSILCLPVDKSLCPSCSGSRAAQEVGIYMHAVLACFSIPLLHLHQGWLASG